MRYNVFYTLNGVKHHKVLEDENKSTYNIKRKLTKLGATDIKVKLLLNGTEGKL